mmetsp:Transcript_57773/g.95856  ORF Transcript_57773/g.95856 Transcript_57773/m.95856 type:complete len:219 (+) Transcript_57773:24-680(+)
MAYCERSALQIFAFCIAFFSGLLGIVFTPIGYAYYLATNNYDPSSDEALRAECTFVNTTVTADCEYQCNCVYYDPGDTRCDDCFDGIRYQYFVFANRTGQCEQMKFKTLTFDTGCKNVDSVGDKLLDVEEYESVNDSFPCWSYDCDADSFETSYFCVGYNCGPPESDGVSLILAGFILFGAMSLCTLVICSAWLCPCEACCDGDPFKPCILCSRDCCL